MANQTGIKWAFFDQPTLDLLLAPVSKGANATTDSLGKLLLPITNSQLAPNGIGYISIGNSNGTINQLPSPLAFSGTVLLP